MKNMQTYNYNDKLNAGIVITAGGFEDRALTFANKLRKRNVNVENNIILRYTSQPDDNNSNYEKLFKRMKWLMEKDPYEVEIDAEMPVKSSENIKKMIENISRKCNIKTAFIDISGMTHLWAISALNACVLKGFQTNVIYTEAKWYYPKRYELNRLLRAWKNQEYMIAAEYLQSAALKSIQILPEFGGNIRSSKQTCLIIFAGYEPNRIQGLVDSYAPGALIVYYGKSPHNNLNWRNELSRELHKELFSQFRIRQVDITTFYVEDILKELNNDFSIISDRYDIAIAPQCSKMQAVGVYEFWRRHPEVQLVFTTPVKFNPNRYSRYSRETFVHVIGL